MHVCMYKKEHTRKKPQDKTMMPLLHGAAVKNKRHTMAMRYSIGRPQSSKKGEIILSMHAESVAIIC